MREIKFRAWDKDHDERYNWKTIKSEFVMRDFENDSLVMMQYTGLKDKNGTEIYEGDVFALEVPYIDFTTGNTIYEKEYIPVTYEKGSYVLYEQGIQTHDLYDVLGGWNLREGYKCDGLILGNIHEHKHLLEGK